MLTKGGVPREPENPSHSFHYSSFQRTIEFIRVSGELGIVMGAETVHPIGKAPLAGETVQRRFTNIWRKEAGTWRMIARHAHVIPPS